MTPTVVNLARLGDPDGFAGAVLGLLRADHEGLGLPHSAWARDAERLRGRLAAAAAPLASLLEATSREAKPDRARLTLARGVVDAYVGHFHAEARRNALDARDHRWKALREELDAERNGAQALDDAAFALRRRALKHAADHDPRRADLARELEQIAQEIRAQADDHTDRMRELGAIGYPPQDGHPPQPSDLLHTAVFDAVARLAGDDPTTVGYLFDRLVSGLLGEPTNKTPGRTV